MKYGLCLSGGAALGFAHIGALMAIEEAGIEISEISGASMGAIIGSLYCAGYSPNDMINIIEGYELHKIYNIVKRPNFAVPGLSKHDKVEQLIKELIPHNSFEGLKKRFYLSVTDIAIPDWDIISEGELSKMIVASMAIPLIFEPVIDGEKIYVDGGVMNNLPIEPLKDSCDYVIGVDVQTISPLTEKISTKIITERYYGAMMMEMQRHRVNRCNKYIRFRELEDYNLHHFNKYKEIVDIGYNGTKRALANFKG